ncbi:MAG: hypothetical protein FWH41_06480 [Treponema sp.]|nr:hypothetical protein [Treponema sp.]
MLLEIIQANPAGNITIFVMNPPERNEERMQAARKLMADARLKAEQIAFVKAPAKPGEIWRMEMAGGEFCGNASRSFALLAAKKEGLSGKHTVLIATSGMKNPLPVHIDTETQTAEIEIPPPVAEKNIEINGQYFPLYAFDGITHIIAENMPPKDSNALEGFTRSLVQKINAQRQAEGLSSFGAIGVMFFNAEKSFLQPAVWTQAAGKIIFESSCGSGSAALGIWAMRNETEADREFFLEQPGGTIAVHVKKQAGKISLLSISGKVTFGDVMRYEC